MQECAKILEFSKKNSAQKSKKKIADYYTNITFKPRLNPQSEILAEKARKDTQDLVARLYHKQKEYDFKVWVRQQEKENVELDGCTFHPNVFRNQGNNSHRNETSPSSIVRKSQQSVGAYNSHGHSKSKETRQSKN